MSTLTTTEGGVEPDSESGRAVQSRHRGFWNAVIALIICLPGLGLSFVFFVVMAFGLRLRHETPWPDLLIVWVVASSPLAIGLLIAVGFFFKSTPSVRAPGSWVRVPLLSVLCGVVWALIGVLLIAPLEERNALIIGVATLGLLVGTKLLFDLATSWSRLPWLPICTSFGLLAGAVGLHFATMHFLRARAMDPTAWGEAYAPLFERGAPYFLWCVPLGTIVAMVLFRLPTMRRALRHIMRVVGGAAAATLFVLLILTTGRTNSSTMRGPGSPLVEVPLAWENLGGTALAFGAALLIVRLASSLRPVRRPPPPPAPGYRTAATQSEPDSKSIDAGAADPAELAGLRWEVPAVAVVCFGLAPLLAAAREGIFPRRAAAPASSGGDLPGECGDGKRGPGESCDDGNTETERLCPTDAACTVCDKYCAVVDIDELVPAVVPEGCKLDHTAADVSGFSFWVDGSPLVVSQLGFYDEGADGLGEAHQVGIFNLATEALVVTATIPAGTVAPESGGFRYVSVAPTVLSVDNVYAVLAHRTTSVDGIGFSCRDFRPSSFLHYYHALGANGASDLVFTNERLGYSNAWFGPSFRGAKHRRAVVPLGL